MNRLQERRLALGLTQPQVSARLKEIEARADVGMVSRYEKGVCLPTEAQLAALEGVLQADRLELFDAEDLDLLGVLREFAESLPDDLLQVCGYSSWQIWHDAAMKRLLAEYAARKRAGKKGGKTA